MPSNPPSIENISSSSASSPPSRSSSTSLHKVIVGQEDVLELLLAAIFARGHCLLVGVPGLAKTLMISTLAKVLKLNFNRIQFTPDLMPADITGTDVLEEDQATGKRAFRFVKGPIFANIILADEINRTPPKTQAALLAGDAGISGNSRRAGRSGSSRRSLCWRRRIRSSRRGRIRCPRRSWIGSCSWSTSAIRASAKSIRL